MDFHKAEKLLLNGPRTIRWIHNNIGHLKQSDCTVLHHALICMGLPFLQVQRVLSSLNQFHITGILVSLMSAVLPGGLKNQFFVFGLVINLAHMLVTAASLKWTEQVHFLVQLVHIAVIISYHSMSRYSVLLVSFFWSPTIYVLRLNYIETWWQTCCASTRQYWMVYLQHFRWLCNIFAQYLARSEDALLWNPFFFQNFPVAEMLPSKRVSES